MNHNMLTNSLLAAGTNHLVESVFHDTNGQTGADIGHGGPVLLGLFNAAVHENGTATTQIHRHIGKKAYLGEFLGAIA